MNRLKRVAGIQMDLTNKNININANNNFTKVISPKLTNSIYSIPDCPKNIDIKNVCDLHLLKKLEYDYEQFLEKRCQILLLLNMMEQVFEIRDMISMRINVLEREYKIIEQKLEYKIQILFQ